MIKERAKKMGIDKDKDQVKKLIKEMKMIEEERREALRQLPLAEEDLVLMHNELEL